ncbi:hypothetical protein [Streptomyces sp. NPDC056010]|uniref:hypothetical protein n=1 Tax=Streptomyces sp. NPDC056010 TaxID=3345679 RepID=UPI0035DB4222
MNDTTGQLFMDYAEELDEKWRKLKKRGFALAAEHTPPTGQAASWYEEVIQYVPRTGRDVARQIARLAGEGCEVTIPWRSLADAVGKRNRAGNLISYTQRGVEVLVESGWLTTKTVGQKRGAKTTFSLEVGDLYDWTHVGEQGDYAEDDD